MKSAKLLSLLLVLVLTFAMGVGVAYPQDGEGEDFTTTLRLAGPLLTAIAASKSGYIRLRGRFTVHRPWPSDSSILAPETAIYTPWWPMREL